jgi:DNA-binding transcriptional ArsR family regulator
MGSDLRGAVVDLAWSLLTELGVPGLVRRHQAVAIDPEPVVLLASLAVEVDARLRDQLLSWLLQHGSLLSVSRLGGLLKAGGPTLQARFSEVAQTVRATGGPRLPTLTEAVPFAASSEVKTMSLPLGRSSLVRLRLRALCGVGARADVLSELLLREDQWTRTVDLADIGYSKRSVASVLSELAEAGVVERVSQGNAHRFRLGRVDALAELVAGAALERLEQVAVLRLVEALLDVGGLRALPGVVRRVEATKRHARLSTLAMQLDLGAPPPVRGVEEAWELLVGWGVKSLREVGGQTRDSNPENGYD